MFDIIDSMFGFDRYDRCDYYGFDSYGPNRRNWREKSDAAMRREYQAKQLVDAFIEECKTETSFPVTKEIVPASVHLTEACWKTFKQYVVAKGCKTKRREATVAERRASKDTRKGKLWVTSVTVPVNPTQLDEKKKQDAIAAEERKKKALQAAEKKRLAEEKKAEQERAIQAKAKEIFTDVVATLKGEKIPEGVLKEGNGNAAADENPSPKKRQKLSNVTVPTQRIVSYAEHVHRKNLRKISDKIRADKAVARHKILEKLDTEMAEKEAAAKAEAKQYHATVVDAIQKMETAK